MDGRRNTHGRESVLATTPKPEPIRTDFKITNAILFRHIRNARIIRAPDQNTQRMATLVPGQRWISNAEPELGLGTVVRIEPAPCRSLFATAGVMRHYALHSAPLTRAEFRPGPAHQRQQAELRHRARQRERRALRVSRRRAHALRIRARRRAADFARRRAAQIRARRFAGTLRLPRRRAAPPRRSDALARLGPHERTHRPDRAPASRRRHRLSAKRAACVCSPTRSASARRSRPA